MRSPILRVRAVWAAFFLCLSAGAALGADAGVFSWRQAAGRTVRVMLNRHPYSEGIKRKIAEFENLTGIRVAYLTLPEESYFPRLDAALDDESSAPDVYMTGAYQVWDYAPAGKMLPLDSFILDSVKTRQGYGVGDFFPGIAGAFRWSGKAGSRLGEGPLWAAPVGFEAAALVYNREVLARYRLSVPSSMEDLIKAGRTLNGFEGDGAYGVAARGLGTRNALPSGYITAFVNYGAKDMEIENGRLVSRVNSPEAVAATSLWLEMQKACGPVDWENSNRERCLEDIGSRRTALLYDSDIIGYYANTPGASSQSGKLGLAPPPAPAGTEPGRIRSNLWVWGLAINPNAVSTDAAWLFVQYFTSREFQSYSVLDWRSVNPPRRSVFEDPAFQRNLSLMEGYAETISAIVDNTSVLFTPNPHFFAISERWAAVVRDIANGVYPSAQAGLDALKAWMDKKLADARVE